MNKVINIQDRLKNSNRSKDKDISNKNIGPQKDKITLVPRENRILLDIIENEITFLNIATQELTELYNHTNDSEITVEIKELQEYCLLFELIYEHVRNSFGLDFMSKLTLRELATLAAAVEEILEDFELDDSVSKKMNQSFKKEIYDLHDKLIFHFTKVANSSEVED